MPTAKLIVNTDGAPLEIPLDHKRTQQILDLILNGKNSDSSGTIQHLDPPPNVKEFSLLCDNKSSIIVKFFVERNGEGFNDELATQLGLKTSGASSVLLGKVTQKLRRVGISAEGHLGENWYKKQYVGDRTYLRLRPDILKFFKDASRTRNF